MEYIVAPVVTSIVESLMVHATEQLSYLISCKDYVSDMDTKKKDLDNQRVNVEEHKNHNQRNNLVVPAGVDDWLEKVRKIDEEVAKISSDVGSCYNIMGRHQLGSKAFNIIKTIDCLIEDSKFSWTDHPIPLGKVDSKKPSTSTPSSHHNDFSSRERTFMEALKQLHPDHKSRIIALCGMGGVGKTTMMEKLKKHVGEEKKMFDMIVHVDIGEKTYPITIQQSVADFLGVDLKRSDKGTSAIKIRKGFEATSEGGKRKILVILDDVWELVNLSGIGLSPLPNQGVGFKILLTSRDRDVCTRMKVDSIFDVASLQEKLGLETTKVMTKSYKVVSKSLLIPQSFQTPPSLKPRL